MAGANFNPVLVTVTLGNVRFASPEVMAAGAQRLLDETGTPILDEEGRYIYEE